MPVIQATWKAEVGRSQFEANQGSKNKMGAVAHTCNPAGAKAGDCMRKDTGGCGSSGTDSTCLTKCKALS
jgi:hypothetical protein